MINHKIQVDDDFEYLLERWSFCDNGSGYPVACIDGKNTYLHHVVMGKKKGLVIDHINGDKLDNRRSNLRHITQHQNTWNRKLAKTNKTGYTGITYDGRIKKWIARIAPDKKSLHLGSFSDIKDALLARKKAELVYME